MSAILGIDAAWTPDEPSGVALIRTTQEGSWECVKFAPSYDAFIESAGGNAVRWETSAGKAKALSRTAC